MADFSGSIQGSFVDDDDIVRTGRVMIELDGYNMLHVPIPSGVKQAWDDLRGESSSNLAEIRSKAAQAGEAAGAASKSAASAKASESNAATSKDAASSSAAAAAKSESSVSSVASAAKASEKAAAGSASAASSSASSAKQSENNAAAAKSAAAGSASAAASSASSAKQDADRAVAARTATENIANSTSWSGDQLTVNGKTSPSLRGPKGDPGASTMADISDLPEITPLARANAVVQRLDNGHILVLNDPPNSFSAVNKGYVDKVAFPRGVKPIKGAVDLDDYKETGFYHQGLDRDARAGTNYPNNRAGLLEVFNPEAGMTYQRYTDYGFQNNVWTRGLYSGKWSSWVKISQDGHKHTMSDISDLPPVSKGASAHSIAQRNSDGTLYVSEPASSSHAANKSYVDTALGTAKSYTDALIVVGDTNAKDGKLHIVYE